MNQIQSKSSLYRMIKYKVLFFTISRRRESFSLYDYQRESGLVELIERGSLSKVMMTAVLTLYYWLMLRMVTLYYCLMVRMVTLYY